ncbi:MAG: YggS family pyridoxal phosphate-dependent enzyme [Syntrophobacteraceae bacterium]|nr:YggS family pyridoxal phosphate-dependent enzyme [Syntrophobacteraceae bacterium]
MHSSEVAENLEAVRLRIAAACDRARRDPSEVKLVGVTKTVPADRIREAIEAGLEIIGENYIQEAKSKREQLAGLPVVWHFIGHLQSNKAKTALECSDWIETLHSEALAIELNRRAANAGRKIPVLIQVNIGEEDTKSGMGAASLPAFLKFCDALDCLDVRGLMALPPFFDQPERARPYFRRMRELLDTLKAGSPATRSLTELSMGMSGDFEVAIEEGATIVRVGTAIFGQRRRAGESVNR